MSRIKSELSRIEEQHEKISSIINSLLRDSAEGANIEDLRDQLKELVNLLHNHFATENALMAQSDFPNMTVHMREHKRIFEEINSLYQQIKRGEKALSPILADYFRYLEDIHIASVDKELIEFCEKKLNP
ncbi:MAG: hemerythrin family protein [Nitrospinota bacterium]|nr:hemerythrin family protein [Nitrospinota bacterium]